MSRLRSIAPAIAPPLAAELTGTPPDGFQAILGASNIVLDFDARRRSAAGSWQDSVRSLTLASPGTLTAYAADGNHFRGLPVHQCAISGNAGLAAITPNPVIWSAGARPYVFGVARFRSYPSGFLVLMKVANAATTANAMILLTSSGTQLTGSSYTSGTAAATFSDTSAVHAFEIWLDSSGVFRFAIDGVEVATAGTGLSHPDNSGHLSLGGNQIASANMTDSSHAKWLFCNTVPSAAQRAQVLALARSIWNF